MKSQATCILAVQHDDQPDIQRFLLNLVDMVQNVHGSIFGSVSSSFRKVSRPTRLQFFHFSSCFYQNYHFEHYNVFYNI